MTLSTLGSRLRDATLDLVPSHRDERPKIRVLLVDEEPAFLHIAQTYLEAHHADEIEVLESARSGEEGLTKAQLLSPQVLLLGLNPPGLSGLQMIPLLRIIFPEMRIIALTLKDSERSRRAVLAAGANDLVSKTSMRIDLVSAIRSAMAEDDLTLEIAQV